MAVWFSLAAAGAHAALHVAFTWRGKIAAADGMLGVFFVVFNFWCAELGAAARLVPAGFACAGGWLAARAASNVVLTERYKFLPQSLGDGPVSASAPLLASLASDSTPFAQHAAYADLWGRRQAMGRGLVCATRSDRVVHKYFTLPRLSLLDQRDRGYMNLPQCRVVNLLERSKVR